MESRVTSPTNETRDISTHDLAEDLKAILQRTQEKARERAKDADRVVREHPYETIGFALGLGILIGVLAGRRWGS